MIEIVRKPDGTIKSYAEKINKKDLSPGETVEFADHTMESYSSRLMMTANGKSGELVKVKQGTDEICYVFVDCPGQEKLDLKINGIETQVELHGGQIRLELDTSEPGLYVIEPAKADIYFSGGNSMIAVEVLE